jgi:hypothetical protein
MHIVQRVLKLQESKQLTAKEVISPDTLLLKFTCITKQTKA